MSALSATTNPPPPPAPPSGTRIPHRVATLLHAARILLGYGRHLADTIRDRAAAPGFTTIASCFGTTRLPVILASLTRGILRATALERLLLERAASGRDIADAASRLRPATRRSVPADAPAPHPPVRTDATRPARCSIWDAPELAIPTLEEIEAQVRRRPLGRTIVDICLDLAVVPGFCTGPFWNQLFELMQCNGGSVGTLMRERCRREETFLKEQDRHPGGNRDAPDWKREAIRRVLGFFIGETTTDPFDRSPPLCIPAMAAATGPP